MRRKRGRPSAAELAIITPLQTLPRLPLPPELRDEEAEEWHRLTNSHEADWFGPGAQAAMVQYCRHVTQARRLAELIERAVGNPETNFDYYIGLLRAQRGESLTIARLGAALRLNPQSLRTDRGNARPPRVGPPPWEAA